MSSSASEKVIELSKQGRDLLKQRDYAKAEESFIEALEIDPDNAYVLVGLGDLKRLTNDFDASLDYYNRVINGLIDLRRRAGRVTICAACPKRIGGRSHLVAEQLAPQSCIWAVLASLVFNRSSLIG